MTNKQQKTLLVIIGATGIGKTDLSIDIAQHFNAEIISCDSRQMFKELKIGTATPSNEQLQKVKHHFIGNLSVHDDYNAGQFEIDALKVIDKLFTTNPYVVMTGGSGLYADAVTKGIDDLPTISKEVREKLLNELEEKGLANFQNKLKETDPEYYAIADLNNSKRILKALEVFEMTGKKYSSLRTETVKQRDFKIIQIGLQMDRETLYERINKRVDIMVEEGLIEEARAFLPYKNNNSLNTVGYKELFGYFENQYDLNEAIRLIKRNSRHYAKRQISWFNRDKSIHWFHPSEKDKIIQFIEEQQ